MVSLLSPSLMRSSVRFFSKHPWQFFLTLSSIALGAAVMIAVDLANNSARESFSHSIESVSGRMTHHIKNAQGAQAAEVGLDENLYADLRIKYGYHHSAPIIEGEFSIQGEVVTLLGMDVFAEPLFQQGSVPFSQANIRELLTKPNTVMMSIYMAKRLGIGIGKSFVVRIAEQEQILWLQGLYPETASAALDNLMMADIATAQELFNKIGHLDRIELILQESEVEVLQALLPENTTLVANQASANALDQMTHAFRTNLTAMSLLAMLVGAFLVYNTMTFSVLQRRQQFAIERMIGVTGLQLFLHILIEALIMGIIGGILGVLLGVVLGQGLLILVSRTISDLYSAVDMSVLQLHPMLLLKGIGITLTAVILATLAPALEAAKVSPAAVNRQSELEIRNQAMTPYLFAAGLLLMLMGGGLIVTLERSLVVGFIALFMIIVGYSLMIPRMIVLLLTIFKRFNAKGGLLWSLAIRGIASSLSRTNLAIIALAVAVSATVGVGIMISSFRATVVDWLDMTLYSDVYISSTNESGAQVDGLLEPFWIQQVQQLQGIKAISTGKKMTLQVKDLPIPMMVLSGTRETRQFQFLDGDEELIWQRYLKAETVLISEPFSYHQQLKRGDVFSATTDNGKHLNLEVGGIFQDYSATQGMVVMPRGLYAKHWQDADISSIGMILKQDVDPHTIRQQLSEWAKNANQPVRIRSDKEIRDTSLEVFDRTFAITNVLRLLVIIVAFVGVFSALMALFLEKNREYAVLRATGLTPSQLTKMVFLQTLLIGFLAGLLALPLGWLMSEVLIQVINQRSFGWTMGSEVSPMIILHALSLSIGAALLAGVYPTRRISQVSLRQGLRDL